MIRLDGKPVVEAHQKKLTAWLDTMKNQGLNIQMGILLVGNDRSAQMYLFFMEKKAKQAGLGVVKVQLPETATQKEVEEAIETMNQDDSIYGVLPLMPMPKQIDEAAAIACLRPDKDLDGLTTTNVGLVSSGKGGFAPCTPRACLAILDYYKIPLDGKHVVVVGRSPVVGRPVALMALARNATVTICHSHTTNMKELLLDADVVIAAVGKPHLIDGTMIKPGAVVIDVGINELDGKTVGDVDYESIAQVAGALTPVPGGVGTVTTTMMLEGVYDAYHARNVDSTEHC